MPDRPGLLAVKQMLWDPQAPLSLLRWAAALPPTERHPFVAALLMNPAFPGHLEDDVVTENTAPSTVMGARFVRRIREGADVATAHAHATSYQPGGPADPHSAHRDAARFAAARLLIGPAPAGFLDTLTCISDPAWLNGFTDAAGSRGHWVAYAAFVRRWDQVLPSCPLGSQREWAQDALTWFPELTRGALARAVSVLTDMSDPLLYATALERLTNTVLPGQHRHLFSADLVTKVAIPVLTGTCASVSRPALLAMLHPLQDLLTAQDWATILAAAEDNPPTSATTWATERIVAKAHEKLAAAAREDAAHTKVGDLINAGSEHARWLVAHAPGCTATDWSAFVDLLDGLDPEETTLAQAMDTFTALIA